MYESFFGLHERPFAAAPLARNYFAAAAIENARQTLSRCIDRAEGVSLVIGPAGTGKSLLLNVLTEQFHSRFCVALLDSGRVCTRRALLQAILFELGLPYRGMEEGDLRLSLVDHLSPRGTNTAAPSGLLLMVDEAHALPLRLLEELRLLSNLVRQGQPRVRLVLAGGPQLEERLANPKLESFNQRIAARCYLEALDRGQTIDYVRHQISQAGGQADRTFHGDALNAVFEATDGIPRLINQVCDHALILACAGGVRELHASGIEEAWSDLQQLPTPWNAAAGAPPRGETPGVVEFGELDGELSDDLPPAVPFRSAIASKAIERYGSDENIAREEDFQPAGSIGPEVELVFQQAANPFQESFDEEEVVLDPYAALDANVLANRPQVRSDEGRELGEMLTPYTSYEEPAADLSPTTWPGGLPTERELPAGFDPQQEPSATAETSRIDFDSPESHKEDESSAWNHVPQLEELARGEQSPQNTSQPVKPAPQIPTQPLQMPIPPVVITPVTRLRAPETKKEVIVVDDPPWQITQSKQTPKPTVRRYEFRNLFARLRRE